MSAPADPKPPLPIGTQAAVAKRLKLSVSFVSRVATGQFVPTTAAGAERVLQVRKALEREADRRRAILEKVA
jgi:hypothetical protein